jgi:Cdc6-like AAA superfamily ATPase
MVHRNMSAEVRVSWINSIGKKLGRKTKKHAEAAALSPLTLTPPAQATASPKRPAGDAPRFHSMASDQLDRRSADKFLAARLKLRDAYLPAQPVTDARMFAGRTGLLISMIRAIEDRHVHMIVYGERGIGKTSLMHVLAQRAREARYHVSYISCGAAAAFDETFRAIAAQIPLLFHEDYGPTSPEGEKGQTIADLLPESEISPRMASEFCARVVGTRVLVIMDEFERPQSAEFRRYVGEFLKNLSDRSVRVHLVIAGVASNLEDLLEPGGFVQRNIVALEVPKMTAEEVTQLIQNGEVVSGLTFDREAMDALIFGANGLPHLASLLSQQAGLSAINDQRLNVTLADVPQAMSDALNEISGRLSKRLRGSIATFVRESSFAILGPLASSAQRSEGSISVDDLISIFGDPDLAAQSLRELEKLKAQGIVTASEDIANGKSYRFVDPNALAYLWLLAAERQLLAEQAPISSPVVVLDRVARK